MANEVKLPSVKVEAIRHGGALDTISRNVTRITREDIENQRETSQNVAEMLGRLVPGMAPTSQTFTNFNQTLRGRNVLVLIDGVPMKTNRNISRDLFNLEASAIESIEVVHGGSSVYGGGAAGGVIHINTLQGLKTEGVQFETTFGGNSSLSQIDKNALGGRLEQKVFGKTGKLDYTFSASGKQSQGFFDAKGDRIAPEPSQGDLSDTGTINLFGKLGYEFGDDQRLSLTTTYLNRKQDTNFVSDPSVNDLPAGSVKARAIKGLQLDNQTANENLVVNLGYTKQNLLGSKIQAQAYYRKNHNRFFPFDGRPFAGWNSVAQTFLDSQVGGGRLTINTPITPLEKMNAFLLWGADINHESTKQPATIFDGNVFDQSGGRVFEVIDKERTFVPKTRTSSYGLFGQLELIPLEQVVIRGGIRHEFVDVNFGDFTTLGQGNKIQGGNIDYSKTTFNAGIVYTPITPIDLYFNFAQAFELPDIGLQLRFAPEDFNVTDSNLKPQITDTYEIGTRWRYRGLQLSAAGFYSTSNLGRVLIEDFSFVQQRTPTRIYGVESSLNYSFNDQLKIGGTFSWQKGEQKDPINGEHIALNGFRIPPLKLTGYIEYRPFEWWLARVQVLHSGNRDDAADDGVGFGGRKVSDYTLVDLYSSFDTGPGVLRVGIENILNNQYHTVFGQLLRNGRNSSHLAARGATARVSYTLRW